MYRVFYCVLFSFFLTHCATVGHQEIKSGSQVDKLHLALNRYKQLKHHQVFVPTKQIEIGDLTTIHQRLVNTGDLSHSCAGSSELYKLCIKEGIAHFQSRNGLKADGTLGPDTLKALNQSYDEKIALIQLSIDAWKKVPVSSQYLIVNIPAYELYAMNQLHREFKMKVVVGLPNWQTPSLNTEVRTVVLNPSWNVPVNITEKEIIHKIVQNPNYLEEHNLKIVENWSHSAREINPTTINWQDYVGAKDLPYRLKQLPGQSNALGQIKFVIPNAHHIYLHDTPLKSVFNANKRDLSHGCIRLDKPMQLLQFLATNNANLNEISIAPYLQSKETKYLALKNRVPIHIIYAPAWVDDQGLVQFRPDIYKKTNG